MFVSCCVRARLVPLSARTENCTQKKTGTGRTGFSQVPPNPYSFYDAAAEVYAPLVQSDGGQLSGARALCIYCVLCVCLQREREREREREAR